MKNFEPFDEDKEKKPQKDLSTKLAEALATGVVWGIWISVFIIIMMLITR